ncbi:MAG: hypothetical protein PHR83_04725 [Paludibacter sp.]|nr:hypothetical protein [Paludibacter sp.]
MKKPIYNIKNFILPDSHRSMSAYHAKVMEDGIMKLTIHDCKRSVQFKNDLNNPEEITEAIQKLDNLANGILKLKEFIQAEYEQKLNELYL